MPSQSRHNSTIPAHSSAPTHKPLSLASASLSTPSETRNILLSTRPYKPTTTSTHKPKAYATTVPEGKNLAEWLEISKILDSWIEVVGSEWSGSGSGDDGEAEDEKRKAITEKNGDEMKRQWEAMVEYTGKEDMEKGKGRLVEEEDGDERQYRDSRRYVKTRSRQTSDSKRVGDWNSKKGHRIEHQRNRQTSCGNFTRQLVERTKYGSDKRRNGKSKSESQIRGANSKRQLGTGRDNVKLEILSDVSCDHHTPEAPYEKSQNNGTPPLRYESASDGKAKEKALLLLHDTRSFMTNVHGDSQGTTSYKRPTNKENVGDTPGSPYQGHKDTDISALELQRSPRSTESYQQSAKMNSESDSTTRSESRPHRGSENLRQKFSPEYRAYSPKRYRPLKDLQKEQNQASYTGTEEYLPANITPAKSNIIEEYTAVQGAPGNRQTHKQYEILSHKMSACQSSISPHAIPSSMAEIDLTSTHQFANSRNKEQCSEQQGRYSKTPETEIPLRPSNPNDSPCTRASKKSKSRHGTTRPPEIRRERPATKETVRDEDSNSRNAPRMQSSYVDTESSCTFTKSGTANTASSNITISQPKLRSEETTPEFSVEQKNEDAAKLPAKLHQSYPSSIEQPPFQPSIPIAQAPRIPAYTTTEKILEHKLKRIEELRKEVAQYIAAAEDLAEKQAVNKGRVCCLHGIPCSCEFSSIHHRFISGNNAEKAGMSRDISIPGSESSEKLPDVLPMEVYPDGKGPDARVHAESDIHKTQRSLEQVHPDKLFAADFKDMKAALPEYDRDLYIPPSPSLHETHPAFRNKPTKTGESNKQSTEHRDKEEEETNPNTSPPHPPASPPPPIPTTHNHSPTPTATQPTPTPIRRPSKLRRVRAITNLRSTSTNPNGTSHTNKPGIASITKHTIISEKNYYTIEPPIRGSSLSKTDVTCTSTSIEKEIVKEKEKEKEKGKLRRAYPAVEDGNRKCHPGLGGKGIDISRHHRRSISPSSSSSSAGVSGKYIPIGENTDGLVSTPGKLHDDISTPPTLAPDDTDPPSITNSPASHHQIPNPHRHPHTHPHPPTTLPNPKSPNNFYCKALDTYLPFPTDVPEEIEQQRPGTRAMILAQAGRFVGILKRRDGDS